MVNNLLSIGIVGLTIDQRIIFEYEANIESLETHTQDTQCMQTFWLKPAQSLAWEKLQSNRRDYMEVFEELGKKLKQLAKDYKLKFVAHPVCFDWMFVKCYYELAKLSSPNNDDFYDIGYQCTCSSTLWEHYKKINNLDSTQANKLFNELGEFDKKQNHIAMLYQML
jgi:hypothetical protein